MFAWLKKLFDPGKELELQSVSLWSQAGLDAYERAKSPLKEKNESIARELVTATLEKDKPKARAIGKQLNSAGGIQRMQLVCYRVRHLGGDDRWLEMIWSGIGSWYG